MKESAAQQRWRSYGPPIILILGLLVLWEVLVTWQAVPPWILPAPSQIIQAMWQNADLLLPHVLQTMKQVLLGLGLAIVTGVALAAILDLSSWLRRALYPLLVASQTIPILALAPLLII